jgi:phospholipid/cholesterol/gamma-HCH transport system substrate-binding protein
MKFRIRHADRIVGLFVLVAAIALCGGIILIGANQRWFARNYHFQTRFLSAAGVAPGTAILMKGFQVGKIDRIKLNADNEVDADFVVYDDYRSKARENSILELVTSPIGLGTQLLFHPGKSEALMKEGSFVPLASSEEGQAIIEQELVAIPPKDDTITRLLAGVNPLIESVAKTVVTINRTLTEVNRALAGQSSGPAGRIVNGAADAVASVDGLVAGLGTQVDSLMSQVDSLMSQANAIVSKADGLMTTVGRVAENLEATTESLRDPTGLVPKLLDAKGSIKTLLDDKNAIFDKLSSSLVETEKTLKNVQGITQDLRAQMPSIGVAIDEGRTAIKQAQDVLEGLKNNPLLKGGVPERREQQPIYQGLREGDF